MDDLPNTCKKERPVNFAEETLSIHSEKPTVHHPLVIRIIGDWFSCNTLTVIALNIGRDAHLELVDFGKKDKEARVITSRKFNLK